jgi:hypothetical protein
MTSDPSVFSPNESGLADSEFPIEPPHFSEPRIPDDIQVPWGFLDLGLLLGFTGTVFIALLACDLFGVHFGMLRTTPHDQSLFSVIGQAAIDFLLLGYLALHVRLRFQVPFWQTIGWRSFETARVPRGVALAGLAMAGAAISLVVDTVSNLYPPKGAVPIDAVYQDRLSTMLFLLMAVLLAPVVEETIFRGYLYPVFAKAWGAAAGIVVTGALFGLLHGFQLGGALWQIALLVLVGIIFTWVRAATHTVVASYFLHLGYNSFLFLGFLASTHFLKVMPGAH